MAQQFRFRLETVRKLREQARDRQRRVVADAMHQVSRTEQRISNLTKELKNMVDDTRSERSLKRIDVVSLRENQLYRGRLHRKIMEADAELTQHNIILDKERGKLGEASKQLKVIEKLRERQWNRYQSERLRQEQAEYDETSLQIYARRQRMVDREVWT